MAVVTPLNNPLGPADDTVTAPLCSTSTSTNQSLRDVKIHVWKWSWALTSRLGAVLGRKGDDHDCGSRRVHVGGNHGRVVWGSLAAVQASRMDAEASFHERT